MIPHLAVLVEHRLVTDRHRQTDTGPWLVPRMHQRWNWVTFCDPVTRESIDPETQLTQ